MRHRQDGAPANLSRSNPNGRQMRQGNRFKHKDEESEDESSEDGESDSEGEDGKSDSKGEDDFSHHDGHYNSNPFEPSATATSDTQGTISATATTTESSFIPTTDSSFVPTTTVITSTAQATPITSPTAVIATGATISTVASTSFQAIPTDTTSSASPNVNPPNTSSESSNASVTTAAIVIASILVAATLGGACYLLFRYCAPLKTRLAAYRGRKGQRLSGEEEAGVAGSTGSGQGMTEALRQDFPGYLRNSINARSTIATPAPSYSRATAVALPTMAVRAPPPFSTQNGPHENSPENPFSDPASHSRNNSNNTIQSARGTLRNSTTNEFDARRPSNDAFDMEETYAFQFGFDEYAASRKSSGPGPHPSGLTNNPPTMVSRDPSRVRAQNGNVPQPIIPFPAGLNTGLGVTIPITPMAPSPAHFPAPSPPRTLAGSPQSQYEPRIRKSITPSESVSNAPYSPLTFPAGLIPLLHAENSRWSQNSSSVNTRSAGGGSPIQAHSPRGDKSANAMPAPAPEPALIRRPSSPSSR